MIIFVCLCAKTTLFHKKHFAFLGVLRTTYCVFCIFLKGLFLQKTVVVFAAKFGKIFAKHLRVRPNKPR